MNEDVPLPRQFDVVIERDEEGYYVASVPQLPGCHTQAQSLDEVTQRIREAILSSSAFSASPSRHEPRGPRKEGPGSLTVAAR
jgi:HicB_like antitoxin of bacterial toxin-antitoxin system